MVFYLDYVPLQRALAHSTHSRASDRTGLDEFKDSIKAERRDALFLGGGLREGGPFDGFRNDVIAAAKVSLTWHILIFKSRQLTFVTSQEIQPDIQVVQVSLANGPQSIVDQAEEVERSVAEK